MNSYETIIRCFVLLVFAIFGLMKASEKKIWFPKMETRSQELGLPLFSPKALLAERGARDHLESPL